MSDARTNRGWKTLLAVSVVALVIGAAAWLYWSGLQVRPVSPPEPAPPPPAAPAPAVLPADGDKILQERAERLAPGTDLAKWLSGPDIIRRIVAAVTAIGGGKSPRAVLVFLQPKGEFRAQRVAKKLVTHPDSHARYDFVGTVFDKLDIDVAYEAHQALAPFLEAAYAEIGPPGTRYADVLASALRRLTSVTVPEAAPELKEEGLMYIYIDPTLEALGEAEKHLLRMGPKNAALIQGKLKAFEARLAQTPPP